MSSLARSNRVIGGIAALLILLASSARTWAGASQLASSRNPSVPLAVPGNGNSAGPIVSADGRYVVFVSTASDLVPGDNSLLTGDVFVRDRQSNTTALVSGNFTGTGGGNGSSLADAISTDGRYVLFESDASDLTAAADANGVSDIFVRDLLLGTTTLVSVSTIGNAGNSSSSTPVMTPDGRFVAFVSSANNLVANDTNGISDVFVRDLLSGTTTLVSVGATIVGASFTNLMDTPVITPDGRFIAFYSSAQMPAANGNETFNRAEIYRRDLLAGTTLWISTNNPAQNLAAGHPSISDDGRYVAFKQNISSATANVYRFDSVAQSNTLVVYLSGQSFAFVASSFVDDLTGPEMTPDGQFIFYTAGNAIVRWDGQTSTSVVANLNMSGAVPDLGSLSISPAFTPDGRYLAFLCNATNLTSHMVTNAVSNGYHLYFRDLQLGTNYLVDVDTNGVGSTDISGTVPSISTDGRYIAFASQDARFVNGDNNLALDVFVRDMTNGTTELISARGSTVVPQSGSGISSMSQTSVTPDGHWLVFSSRSDDLVTNDANNDQDVFVRDLLSGTTTLVSVGTNGTTPLGGYSGSPSITPDGRYVAFVSAATNLYAGDTNQAADLFIRDLQAGTTVPAFINTLGGVLGGGDVSAPVISADGRYVTFLCRTNSATTNSIWIDTVSNQTVILTNVNSILPPSMSTNGRYVAFSDASSHAIVRDMQTATNIYTNVATANSMALSPDGLKILFSNSGQLTVVDIATASNIFSFGLNSPAPIRSSAQWSANSRYFAVSMTVGALPGDSNNTNDVYLCDLQTRTLTLASLNSAHTGSANAASDSPVISGNGRFVVYRSLATDIVPGITNPPNLFVFDRLTGSNTLVTAETSPAPGWSTWVSKPAVSADGGVIVFQSLKPKLAPGFLDINRVQDVFSAPQSPLLFADGDGDGIPDWWLNLYFSHPNGQAGDLSRAQDDADADGMSNLQEYLTGTIPTSGSSVFRLQLVPINSTNFITLTWPSISGKNYRVQSKDHADDASWQDFPGNIYIGGPQVSVLLPIAGVSTRFYRVLAAN